MQLWDRQRQFTTISSAKGYMAIRGTFRGCYCFFVNFYLDRVPAWLENKLVGEPDYLYPTPSIPPHLPKWQKFGTTCIFHPTFSPETENHSWKQLVGTHGSMVHWNTWNSHCHALNNVNQFEPVLHKLLAIERCHLVIMMVIVMGTAKVKKW